MEYGRLLEFPTDIPHLSCQFLLGMYKLFTELFLEVGFYHSDAFRLSSLDFEGFTVDLPTLLEILKVHSVVHLR